MPDSIAALLAPPAEQVQAEPDVPCNLSRWIVLSFGFWLFVCAIAAGLYLAAAW